jgi:hypothetical protein
LPVDNRLFVEAAPLLNEIESGAFLAAVQVVFALIFLN